MFGYPCRHQIGGDAPDWPRFHAGPVHPLFDGVDGENRDSGGRRHPVDQGTLAGTGKTGEHDESTTLSSLGGIHGGRR